MDLIDTVVIRTRTAERPPTLPWLDRAIEEQEQYIAFCEVFPDQVIEMGRNVEVQIFRAKEKVHELRAIKQKRELGLAF